jgi:hypothetical protein
MSVGKQFAAFTSPLIFDFNGWVHFDKGATTNDVPLSGSASLGATPMDLPYPAPDVHVHVHM